MQDKVKAALLALSPSVPEQAEILKLNRATRYLRNQARKLQRPGGRRQAPACSER